MRKRNAKKINVLSHIQREIEIEIEIEREAWRMGWLGFEQALIVRVLREGEGFWVKKQGK